MYFVYKVKWPNSKLRIKSKVSNKKDIVQMIEVDMDIDNSMVFMNNYLEIYKYNRTLTDAERDDPAKSNKENFLV